MRSVQIQNTAFDPIDLVRSSSSFGVTLGDADVADGVDQITWCHRPVPGEAPPCVRKPNCSDRRNDNDAHETTSTEQCDCGDLSRRKYCSFCESNALCLIRVSRPCSALFILAHARPFHRWTVSISHI